MRRRFSLLIVGLLMCMMLVCFASAATKSSTMYGQIASNYNVSLSGSYSKMGGEGQSNYSYTTLRNTSSSTIYGNVKVTSYNKNNGDGNSKANTKTDLASDAIVVTGGIDRHMGQMNWRFTHYGKACKYTNPSTVLDSLTYYVYHDTTP